MTAASTPSQETINDIVGNAHGNLARVQELLESEPRLIDLSAVWVETPIQAAAHMGNRPIAEYLLDHGAPLDIFTAAALGRLDHVRRLVESDPSLVNAHGVHDMPLLYFPAISGQLPTIEWLVDHGAAVNEAGSYTALHAAAVGNRTEVIAWLLDRGADIDAHSHEGKTALTMAEEAGRTEAAELLRARGATASTSA